MQPSRTIRLLGVCLLATPLSLVASPALARAPTAAQTIQDTQSATQPTAIDPPPGVLLAVEGDVSTIRGPRIEPASGGMPLDLRESLETGSGGALIIWNDAIVIAVGDNTSLHALSPHRLHLSRGRLVLLVPPARPDALQPIGSTSPIITIENGSIENGFSVSRSRETDAVDSGSTRLDVLQPGEYELYVDGTEGDRQTMQVAVRIGRAVLGDAQRRIRLDPRESAKMRAGGKPRETLYWKKTHVTRFAAVLARLRDIREGRTPLSAQYLPGALDAYAWLFDLYGSWYVDQEYGYYWVPRVADGWQPYGAGRWIYRDYGWVWVDDAEWGWATQHYGRWTMDARGTWAWRPDDQWSGGWVRWETVDEEIVWCALGWDDYPAYEYPYDRSRERYRGSLPRRGWLSARPTREAHHIRPDPPGRWPAIDRPARPPAPPAGPPPPTDAPALANVAVPRDRGTAVPRSAGVGEPRDERAVARGAGEGGNGGVAVRRVEADAVDAESATSLTRGVAVPRNPRPAALLGGTAIPRQQPTASGVSLSTVARDAPPAAALHEQGARTPARSPQRAQGSGGSEMTTGAVDRNREAWDRYQAEISRQQSRDSADGRPSAPARSPQRARSSSTPQPDPSPTPPPVSPSEPEPAPTPPPEPAPAPPPEPTPTPTPTPAPAPEPPPPAPQARPRDPDPDPPSRAAPRPDPDPPSSPPPSSDPPARAVPRDPDEPQSAPSRRQPDEPASSGPRRRHP